MNANPGLFRSSAFLALLALASTPAFAQTGSEVTNAPPGLVSTMRAVPLDPAVVTTPPPTNHAPATLTNGVVFAGNKALVSQFKREIRLTADAAVGDYGRLKVRFPAEPTLPLHITAPDGRVLAPRAAFLVAWNVPSDEVLLLASVTNSAGLLVSPSRVVYTNCFDSIQAHLIYEYDGNSLVQNVAILEQPALPDSWVPQDTRIEVWTAWSNAEPVSVTKHALTLREATAQLPAAVAEDQTPNFGMARLLQAGSAFRFGSPEESFPVAKTWARIPGDTAPATAAQGASTSDTNSAIYLIEGADHATLKPRLDLLPKPKTPGSAAAPSRARSNLLRRLAALPAPAPSAPKAMLAARSVPIPDNAVVLDYTLICSVPVPPGIVSWWPASGDAQDAEPAANHGTLLNGAAFAAGKVGSAFSFNGTQNVQVANSASLNPTNGLTIDAWVYPTGKQNQYRDLVSKDGEWSERQYLLGLNNQNKFRAHVGVGGTLFYVDATNTVSLSNWYHVAMTYNGTALTLYVNGVAQNACSVSGPIIATTQPVRIGGGEPANVIPYYFQGLIDEPDIFDRALSAAEILSIYHADCAGKINPACAAAPENISGWWSGDSHAQDLVGTNAGALLGAAGYAPGYVSHSFHLDGNDSSVEVPDTASTDLNPRFLTIETWVRPSTPGWDHQDLVSKDGEGFDRQYLLTASANGRFRAHVGVSEGFVYFDGATSLTAGTWYHVAMTYDGTDLKLYVNGAPDGAVTLTNGGPIIPTTQPVRIGGGAPGGQYQRFFAGDIDEPAIYARALTGTEIAAIASAGKAGKCKWGDSDSDGLPDEWEMQWFGNLNQTASGDPEGDGYINIDEYLHHTSPTTWTSLFGLNPGNGLQVFTPLK